MEEAQLIGLLARACERLVGSVFAALDDHGFTGFSPTQALAVRMLAAGPMTAGVLATALGVTPQAAGQISTDLQRQGLAVRGTDPNDARLRPLTLTESGRRAATVMHAAEQHAVHLWRQAAGPGDLEATGRALLAYLEATEVPRAPQPRRMRFT